MLSPILRADEGPGLGNLTYNSADVFRVISTSIVRSPQYGDKGAQGEGAVAMHHGWLAVIYAPDSGKINGGFSFYDVSTPLQPVRRFNTPSSTDLAANPANHIREPHGFGFSDSYGLNSLTDTNLGHFVALQAQRGIQFWDWTNHLSPRLLRYMDLRSLAGIGESSDYNDGVWWVFWQAPYVYAGGSGNGIIVVDATDPRNPQFVKRIPTDKRIGSVHAIGNMLIATNNDSDPGIILRYDISDPRNPILRQTVPPTPTDPEVDRSYSSLVNGNKLYLAGAESTAQLLTYDINRLTNEITRTPISRFNLADKGGYLSFQDGFIHMGASGAYQKIDVSTNPPRQVGRVNKTPSTADWDFATALGNVVFVGNDHGDGSRIVVHQAAKDMEAPSVNMVNPPDNATNQKLTSRVGITLTDAVDIASVNDKTFIVRPDGSTGALAGKYSTQMGIVNFSPDQPLQPGTPYEVVVEGIKDYIGNPSSRFRSVFTTEGTQTTAPSCTLATPRTPAVVGTSVSFSPVSTTGSDLSFRWEFGDGATATTRDAAHAYTAPGHYTVKLTVQNSTSPPFTCQARQTIHNRLTSNPPRASGTIAFDQPRKRVWVVNPDAGTVTAINDTSPPAKALEPRVGKNPQTIAIAPDGRIWVVNQDSSTISILNGDTGAVVQTIGSPGIPRGSRPFGVVFSPDGASAYVTLQATGAVDGEVVGSLLRLSPSTGALLGRVPNVGPWPRGVAVSADSQRIFVTRFVSPAGNGEVREVSAATLTLTRTFSLRNDPGPDSENSGRGVPNYLSTITISPDGRRAWIPSKKDNTSRGERRDGLPLTFESTVRTIVSQIDLNSNAEVTGARIDFNDRDLANAVAFSPLGDYAFVSTQGSNTVEVIDVYTNAVIGAVDTDDNNRRGPRGLLVVNNRLYLQNFISRTVQVFNISEVINGTRTSPSLIAGGNIIAQAATNETLSAAALRGKRIFYNAKDPKMSRESYISCASCHNDGGQDGRVMDFTDRGEGFRNTIELNGRSGMGRGRVHWTGNFDEIQDFENDMRLAFGGTGFLTNEQFNATRDPLGASKAALNNQSLNDLAAFVASLISAGPSPFSNQDGTMTAAGLRGRDVFNDPVVGCKSCHIPERGFTDSEVNSDVRHNVGTIKSTSGSRLGQPLTGLDTPTLIGVWQTAPYLHDGSAPTLRDVVTTANVGDAHGRTSHLTSDKIDDLVAYMQQLEESAGPAPGLQITNLNNRDPAAPEWSIQSNLQVGNTVYGDRAYTFQTLPAGFLGSSWIRPAADSKIFTGNPLVSFDINVTANVHVATDDRVGRLPWMDSSWVDTGENFTSRETSTRTSTYSIFRRSFPAGTVSLGPQNNSAAANYVIIVRQ